MRRAASGRVRGLTLGLALGVLAASASAQEASTLSAPVALMRAACVATDMERGAFEAAASERGWSPRPHTPGDAPNDWGVRYVSESAQLLLIGADVTEHRGRRSGGRTSYPAFRNCTVAFIGPTGDWRADMAALAAELGHEEADVQTPTLGGSVHDGEFRQWSRRGELMWWTYNPADRVLRMEIYRSLDRRMTFPR